MNCRDAQEMLQQSLDGTPIESPEWLAHLRECADCRALASAGRRLQDGLRLLTAPLPPPDLAERITARVLRDRRRARRRLRRRWAVSLALAAGLLVALTLRLDWIGTARQHPRPDTSTANRPQPQQGSPSAPTLRESAAELGEVFAQLRNATAEQAVGQTRRWVSNVPSPDLPKVNLAAMQPPTHPLREAGEGVSEGLQAVTTSARRAVDLFLRELPMESKSN
jgi:hypothetical protein